jgi:hypothetical protein
VVLADVTMRRGETPVIERGLSGRGEPDEDHALGHERILSDAAPCTLLHSVLSEPCENRGFQIGL